MEQSFNRGNSCLNPCIPRSATAADGVRRRTREQIIVRLESAHCVNASFRCSPLPSAYNNCKLPHGLISQRTRTHKMPYYSKNTGRNAEARHVLKENPTIRKQGNRSEQHHLIESLARGCISQTRSASPRGRTCARPLISATEKR